MHLNITACSIVVSSQISDQASTVFDEILCNDRIPININVARELLNLSAYIEDRRMQLWDHAFFSYFHGSDTFKKIDEFGKFKGVELIVRRVIFR